MNTLSMFSLFANVSVSDASACIAENKLMTRLDRRSEEVIPYIDIKSKGLRDILRDVLRDARAVNLMEDKPSVIEMNLIANVNANLNSG